MYETWVGIKTRKTSDEGERSMLCAYWNHFRYLILIYSFDHYHFKFERCAMQLDGQHSRKDWVMVVALFMRLVAPREQQIR